ncbi:hypothetical protein RvY_18135 [Ramazzottius varieornatus]|uniref:IF rod domain-containing protein n=1 Tax=Ramazzottius varieornatus TaxID=947166 RepID=A0A1D1W4N0_RAMVA|nr:hypothetical protein RvY_18135 [Ramazzottius varieornatus]
MVQALDAELQKMIDEELASLDKEVNTVPNSDDPDAAVSKHMEASLRLWNKLTEIRNNYKVELKKKQDERINFEKDVAVEASKTSSELAALEQEIQRTNKAISSMENQMAQAQAYHQQIQVETKEMEQQVKDLVAEDAALSLEAQEVQKSLNSLEYSIAQAEGDYLRHKSQAEKELALSECTYGKELEEKNQQVNSVDQPASGRIGGAGAAVVQLRPM